MRHPTYGPSILLIVTGAGMILFGILSGTDAGTVGGITFGMMAAGAGLLRTSEIFRHRRRVRRFTPGPLLTLSPREVDKIRRARAAGHNPTVRRHRPDLWV